MEAQAVIGFAFKLPQGLVDDDSLWETLQSRRNVSTNWPDDRAAIESFYSDEARALNKLPTPRGHFLIDDPAVFDAPFFSITAQEAAAMDPQQRWGLERLPGIPIEKLQGSRTAVFAGSMSDDYTRLLAKDPDAMPRMAITGTTASMLANKISWYFNLRGPSMHIDTACSSSLTALDLACQAVLSGSASQALIIGSSVMLTPESSMLLANMSFLSPDGVCYSFDERANGYARGEGVVALIIKPVLAAVRDGDAIRAVIRSTGSNQDGHTAGITQPSTEAQRDLIREVYNKAGLDLGLTRYVEAHGTGTVVGDPSEMDAIRDVFKNSRSDSEPLYVDSIKANIGHLEGASGLAGVIKSILILERGIIPPNALLEQLSSTIDKGPSCTKVPRESLPWPSDGPRRISVNSFGFGGSNAHVIIDDAHHYLQSRLSEPLVSRGLAESRAVIQQDSQLPGKEDSPFTADYESTAPSDLTTTPKGSGTGKDSCAILVWSANSEGATQNMAQIYETYYSRHIVGQPDKVAQLVHTLSSRRSLLSWRAFTVIRSSHDMPRNSIANISKPIRPSNKCVPAFVFTGQGAQHAGMGLELIEYPAFMKSLRESEATLRGEGCDWSLLEELASEQNIHLPRYSQPLCTALQIALVSLLKDMGVIPATVVGHSSGEIAAAYTIGALSAESAIKVAYYRGLLAAELQARSLVPEAMMSVNLSEQSVQSYCERNVPTMAGSLHIACINSTTNCTLSGTEDSINALQAHLENDNIFAVKLRTGVAYHSPSMQRIASEYKEKLAFLDQVIPALPEATMISSVTGNVVSSELLSTAQYWVDNLTSPVRFSDAMQNLLKAMPPLTSVTDIIEVGPHPALQRPITSLVGQEQSGTGGPRYHSLLRRSNSALETALTTFGTLFCLGFPISVAQINQHLTGAEKGMITPLTNCPKYPFDHSQRYWIESRIAQQYLFRQHVPADSLGSPVNDWNPLEPRWRNRLSTASAPWISDHVINDTVIYPGTGMLVMAIEAVKQLAVSTKRQVLGFHVKEAHFLNPMAISNDPDETTESLVHLRPIQNAFEKESSSSEVVIYGYHKERWTRCFRAVISTQYQDSELQPDTEKERALALSRIVQEYHEASASCISPIKPDKFYRHCQEYGFQYGESFKLLQDICWDGHHTAVARIKMPPSHNTTASIFHPAVLDAAIHLMVAQISSGLTQKTATMVPHQMFDTWISAEGWNLSPVTALRSASLMRDASDTGAELQSYTLSDEGVPLCSIGRLVIAQVSRNKGNSDLRGIQRLVHRIDWKPQLSLQSPEQLRCLWKPESDAPGEVDMNQLSIELGTAIAKLAEHVLDTLPSAVLENAPSHLRRMVVALRKQAASYLESGAVKLLSDEQAQDILDRCEKGVPGWHIFPVVLRHLQAILRGEIDALDLVYSGGLADSYYRSVFGQVCGQRFHELFDLLSHENPALEVLEIGAGTGGMTRHVLSTLYDIERRSGTTRFKSYLYTDISPSFFEAAREEFGGRRVAFKTYDVGKDPAKQGLSVGTYDLVLAGGVLHATADIEKTMQYVRSLLKPGGHLLMVETVTPESIMATIGFGVLPGWWLPKEAYRSYSPALSEAQWDTVLKKTGFSGNDLIFRDYESEACHFASLIMSTATSLARPHGGDLGPRVTVVVRDDCEGQLVLGKAVAEKMGGTKTLTLRDLQKVKLCSDDIVVSLLEVGQPLVATASHENFTGVQHLIQEAMTLVWVTSTSVEDEEYPYYGMATGLLRTIRAEAIEKLVVTLSIESAQDETAASLAGYITAALEASMASTDPPEVEFAVRNGLLTTGRLVEHIEVDENVQALAYARVRNEPLGTSSPMMLSIGTPGMLDTLQSVEDQTASTKLEGDELEIEAKVWAVSFRDVFVALGRLPGRDFGWDCAGIVTKVGPRCEFSPGDRVGVGIPGCMRTHIRTTSKHAFQIPENTTFEEAVSFIKPACTAYHSLVNVARLQRNEKILIHSAAGATGQMAVWIAKHCGAEVFATMGSESKKQLLMERFGIPDTHILYSRNTSFAQGIRRLTNGAGVDVILNSLSGESLRASWDCIASYGRFVEIGKADITSDAPLPMANFQRNVSFFAVDLHHMAQTKVDMVLDSLRSVIDLISQGRIQYPFPRHVFPVSEIEGGFRMMQSGKSSGRIIIRVDPSETVPKLLRFKSEWRLRADASYLIVGGLGGLGRSICSWMVSKGARHLILPSRSGAKSGAASAVVHTLREQGIQVSTPICDATSMEELRTTLDACAKSMPPIKGCINAAMALEDSIFESMKYSQWKSTIGSKVDTAWNLHRLLPGGLDFFVLLSSLSGLYGNISLSNYAAGCTFQDSLARYRSLRGEKSIALDIGWMRTIGVIAETEEYQRNREKARDMMPVEEDELLALLDTCCDPDSSFEHLDQKIQSQFLIGATTPALFLSRGDMPIPQVRGRIFSALTGDLEAEPNAAAGATDRHMVLFAEAKGPAERAAVVVEALIAKLARALSVPADYIDVDKTLSAYGVDSLMAVELRNWFINDFDAKVAVFDIMGNTSVAAIGELVVSKCERVFQRKA
ncbi:hypothetical protein F4778DRAFT_798830 [Xylariomycetidae sp. FL2044]|nr:hypothetical protein F4778DRAFT_798830 [Xylariomycetidae sp. FL2044]